MDIDFEKVFERAWGDTRSLLTLEPWETLVTTVALYILTVLAWRVFSPLPQVGAAVDWTIAAVAAAGLVFVGLLLYSLAAAPYRIEKDRRQRLERQYRNLHEVARELREALRASQIDLDRDLEVQAQSASVRLQGLEIEGDDGLPVSNRWMFLLEKVVVANRSQGSRLSLDVYLSVPRSREAGRDDDLVLRERAGAGLYHDPERVEWLKSPIDLEPGESASGHLGFWVPIWAFDDPEELDQVHTDEAVLRFHDHVSGQTVDRKLRDCVSASAAPGMTASAGGDRPEA